MASPQLTSLFQKAESALETVFHTAQDWSLLGPLWRDAGHIIGWKQLIDKTPYWIDFLPIPEQTKSEGYVSALLEGGGTSFSGMIVPNQPLIDKQQVRELTEIFQNNPAAVRMQKQTISRLLTRLHGNHHAHHHSDDEAHRAEHEKDRNHLALLTKALTTAFPDIKPQLEEITSLKLKSGVGRRAEKEAFLVLQRLSNQYAPETTDRTLMQQVRHALSQIPLEKTKAVVKPQDSFFNKLPWQLLLSGAMLAKPVVDLGSFAYTQWQPAPLKTPSQEQVIGDKRTLAEESEKGSLYLGAISLAILMTLLKRGQENGGLEKALKITSGLGHFGTEFSLLAANFLSSAEQYPHLAGMLLQIGDAAKEQIIETASDIAVVGTATDLAKDLSAHLPTANQSVKNNAELGLSVILSVAATHSVNSALELIAPGISVGLTTAMAGYAALKTGHAVKNAIRESHLSEEKTAVASPVTPSFMVKAKNILSTAKVAVTRAINPSCIGQSIAATALSVFANLSFFAPPAQTPVSQRAPTTPTTAPTTPPPTGAPTPSTPAPESGTAGEALLTKFDEAIRWRSNPGNFGDIPGQGGDHPLRALLNLQGKQGFASPNAQISGGTRKELIELAEAANVDPEKIIWAYQTGYNNAYINAYAPGANVTFGENVTESVHAHAMTESLKAVKAVIAQEQEYKTSFLGRFETLVGNILPKGAPANAAEGPPMMQSSTTNPLATMMHGAVSRLEGVAHNVAVVAQHPAAQAAMRGLGVVGVVASVAKTVESAKKGQVALAVMNGAAAAATAAATVGMPPVAAAAGLARIGAYAADRSQTGTLDRVLAQKTELTNKLATLKAESPTLGSRVQTVTTNVALATKTADVLAAKTLNAAHENIQSGVKATSQMLTQAQEVTGNAVASTKENLGKLQQRFANLFTQRQAAAVL